ncbi:MAG TPA: Gfo/Idh/MocA family oxidoreductase [Verrucomicrobiales bacterium]|nr:Gfo/Idh/MocA family oxidoreductase [Verrucomicrobiales bacterium]
MKIPKQSSQRLNRRNFLKGTITGAALFQIVPSHVVGLGAALPPSEQVHVAGIGIGSRGGADVDAVAREGHPFTALCDVDDNYAAKKFAQYPDAKRFKDYRVMMDKMDKDIDAVVIGTPDHTHAVIAMEAMRRGKHVYCEKPLAHSIAEVRTLMTAAHQHKVITQLGNQGHSSDSIRRFCEWIWDGAIGEVHEIHAFCDAFKEVYCQIDKLPKVNDRNKIPEGLDYDKWLGPAQYEAYNPLWVPWNWRGWMSYGTGCLGDWICHVLDPSFWALDLGAPKSIHAEVTGYDPILHGTCYPRGTKITYEFPAKGKRKPVKLTWFDGVSRPPRPEVLEEGRNPPGTGALVYGDKGVIMHGSHGGGGVRIIPEEKMKEYQNSGLPDKKIERVKNHHADWLEAIKENRQAGSNFDFGGPLTQVGLLGAIAIRFPGQTLYWDADSAKITNNPLANAMVNPTYREGWSL